VLHSPDAVNAQRRNGADDEVDEATRSVVRPRLAWLIWADGSRTVYDSGGDALVRVPVVKSVGAYETKEVCETMHSLHAQ
jgi:hypothetical protein